MRLLLMVFIVTCFVSPILNSQAQDESERDWSLVFLIDNHVTVYEPDAQTFRTVADVSDARNIRLSPDSRYIAYTEQISEIETLDDYQFAPKVFDMYFLDLATGEHMLIVGQDDNITSPTQLKSLSLPVWSPDGSQLAWVDGDKLYVYDVQLGETRFLYEGIAEQSPTPNPIFIKNWTASGILIEHIEFDENYINPKPTIYNFYQVDGSVLSVPNPFDEYKQSYMIRTPNGERIALDTGLDWYLLNPMNPNAEPELLSTGRFGRMMTAYPDSLINLRWEIQDAGKRMIDVLSADGEWVATLNEDGQRNYVYASLANNGQTIMMGVDENGNPMLYDRILGFHTIDIDGEGSLLAPSGKINVLIPDEAVLHTSAYCTGNARSTRLEINQTAYVITDSANNMRSEPTTSAEKVGSIPSNDWFNVLDGPVCADGFTWWQVDYAGTIGWTVEAGDDGYWLVSGCPDTWCVRG